MKTRPFDITAGRTIRGRSPCQVRAPRVSDGDPTPTAHRNDRRMTRSRPIQWVGEETLGCLLHTSAIETARERGRRPCIPGDPRAEAGCASSREPVDPGGSGDKPSASRPSQPVTFPPRSTNRDEAFGPELRTPLVAACDPSGSGVTLERVAHGPPHATTGPAPLGAGWPLHLG